MTTPSHFEAKGLSISIYKPSIVAAGTNVTYTPRGTHVGDFIGSADFSFTSQADGGYWEMSFSIKLSQNDLDDWISDGLSRHVEVYNSALTLIWEGFVNQLSANVGGRSVTRGPVMDIMNRVTVDYTLSQIVGNEIVETAQLSTITTDNDDSKLKYGIFERIVSAGTIWTDAEADDLMNLHLQEYAWPETGGPFSNQGQGDMGVSVSCLGYIHFLKNYIYNANTVSVDNVSVAITNGGGTGKMQQVVGADPSDLFTLANSTLFINAILEPQWEDQNSDAYTIIQSMVAKGDGADGRCLFSVGADRHITYSQIPTAVEYYQMLSDPSQMTRNAGNAPIYPWNVLPGKWLLFTDFLIGKTQPSNLRLDQRAMFIERTSYSTPWNLQLDGGKVGTIKQVLAKLGVGV